MSQKITKGAVIQALRETGANRSAAARLLGVSRQAVQQWADRHEDIRAILDDAREELVDVAEAGLLTAARKGEAWAVCFALKTQGKGRGYIERQEHSGPDGKPLETRTEIVFTYDDSKPGRPVADTDGD